MNLVFNHFLAKLYLGALLLLLFSNMLLANTLPVHKCATINLTATNEMKQPVIFELLSNNNSLIVHDVYLGENKYGAFLFPGKHSLKLRQWLLEDYQEYIKTDKQSLKQSLITNTISHEIILKVESDINYRLLPVNKNDEKGLLLEQVEQNCNLQEQQAMVAKSEKLTPEVVVSVKLPVDLESRLYNVMDNIALRNASTTNSSTLNSNMLPLKLMGSFGLTFHNGNDPSNNELKVLTVHPFSVANQLKITSGDIIIKLNNTVDLSIKGTPNSKFQRYVNSLTIGKQVEILVIRDNENRLLTGKYLPTILPESHYQIITDANAIKENSGSCLSLNRSIEGFSQYKIMEHNGNWLGDINGIDSLILHSGIHRFKAKYSPHRKVKFASRQRTSTYYSSGSGDIAPRIRGGNKVGDGGVKKLISTQTGSMKGWFNRSTNSRGTYKSNGVNDKFYEGSSSPLLQYNDNYILNSVDISHPTYGRGVMSMTLKVEGNLEYEITIEQKFKTDNSEPILVLNSSLNVIEIDCDENGAYLALSPLLMSQPMVRSHLLENELQFELDQLLLELKTYYQANGVTQGVVDVYREKKSVNSYGMFGKMVEFEENYALLIKKIYFNSMASKAGLEVGDLIFEFDGEVFDEKNPKELLAGLAKLTDGQEYRLLVQRENKKQMISSVFISKILPAFHLSVDMSSVVKAQQALSNIIDD